MPLPTMRTGPATALLLALVAPAAGCQGRTDARGAPPTPAATASAATPAPAAVASPAARRWLGAHFPPAPAGAQIAIGATVGEADTATFAIADARADGRHLVWLGRRLSPAGAAGDVRYAVVDVLPIAARGAAGEVRYATCGVRAPGRSGAGRAQDVDDVRLDPALLAVGPFGPGSVYTSVGRAWRADTRAGRFVPVAAANVVCLLDGDPEEGAGAGQGAAPARHEAFRRRGPVPA